MASLRGWLTKRRSPASVPQPAPPPTTPPSLLPLLADLLGEGAATILDVGARWGAEDAWYRLRPLAKIVGFEPDAEECTRLNRLSAERGETQIRYVPVALGSEPGPATLHLTVDPACSSLYPPDPAMRHRYPHLACIEPAATATVTLRTLAEWTATEGIADVAFIKLDTQGSEADILRGAGAALLADCLGVEVEVEFSALYQGQPLFADVDAFLRSQGFVLWRLGHLAHYAEGPAVRRGGGTEVVYFDSEPTTYRGGNGRLLWGQAVYFKDYRTIAPDGAGQKKLFLLAALLAALGDEDGSCCCLERGLSGSPLPEPWPGLLAESLRAGRGRRADAP